MTEEENLLRKAIWDIQDLRRRNEVLSAKVEVMDLFHLVLSTQPNYGSQGASIDVAGEMQKRVDEIVSTKQSTSTESQ